MQVRIRRITIQNFKGIREKKIIFNSPNAKISGCNASGKTTIVDAVTWALFGVDSQWNAKFEIRPLDENGEKIHNIVISVCVVLEIDGKEKSFQRQLKENWVTKRGTSERTLQGNVGTYSVDDYPKSEKEYKECVAGIVSEELFKILTSPTYFPNMKWQEQREILMRFVTDISDVELAGQDNRFADLIGELEKAPSTEDIKKKYQKALTEWKKKQAEFPVRIDEAEKQKVDIDVAELELLKNSLNEQIAENKAKQEDISKEFEAQQKASDGILELKFELNDLQRKANEENNRKKSEITNKQADIQIRIDEIKRKLFEYEQHINRISASEVSLKNKLDECRRKWSKENSLEFDENSFICFYCGNEYKEDKKEQLRAEFAQHKADNLARITEEGNSINETLKSQKTDCEEWRKKIDELKKELPILGSQYDELQSKYEKLPDSIDISDRPEVQEIQRQIAEKEAAMNKGNSAEEIRQQLKDEAEELQKQMDTVKEQFVLVKKNDEADDRIAELQKEQREVAQKVADQEKMLYLLEEFIRYKMDSVSETINSKLDGICVKLFENQINGGMKECCELTYGGVPYGSLNNGHRIVAGLKIIKALQNLYGVYAPVFIDNAEALSDFNIPKMDCQMILLTVPHVVIPPFEATDNMSDEEYEEAYAIWEEQKRKIEEYYDELRIEVLE